MLTSILLYGFLLAYFSVYETQSYTFNSNATLLTKNVTECKAQGDCQTKFFELNAFCCKNLLQLGHCCNWIKFLFHDEYITFRFFFFRSLKNLLDKNRAILVIKILKGLKFSSDNFNCFLFLCRSCLSLIPS